MLKKLLCWFKNRKENKYKAKFLAALEDERERIFKWLLDNKCNDDIDIHTFGWYQGRHAKLCELIKAIKYDEINRFN